MRNNVFFYTFFVLTVLTLVGTFAFLVGNDSFVGAEYSYYLLLADRSGSVEVFAPIDFDRGGSGVVYEGQSVLHFYPTKEEGLVALNRNEGELSLRKVEFGKVTLLGFERWNRETIRRELGILNGVIRLLYSLSNELERQTASQEQARSVLKDCLFLLDRVEEGDGKTERKLKAVAMETKGEIEALGFPITSNAIRKIGVTMLLELE